jgi:class 3 adenylate cyclase
MISLGRSGQLWMRGDDVGAGAAGDGFFARFDGSARAIRCALAIHEAMCELGLQVRIGLHAGECELLDGKVAGIAVSISARVSARAAAGQVLVSFPEEHLPLRTIAGYEPGAH